MDDTDILTFLRDQNGAKPIDVAWHLSFVMKDVCFATVALQLYEMEEEGKVKFDEKKGKYYAIL